MSDPMHPLLAASFIPLAAGQHLTEEQLNTLFPDREAALTHIVSTAQKADAPCPSSSK